MENILHLSSPVDFQQLMIFLQQLSATEKQKIVSFLLKEKIEQDATMTHFASEKILAKDWLSPEEDAAWGDL
jgi:hypothetical protein